ncbi:RiPP maturation radical SAM C-methyltransferase [Mobilitalea sibirica]|uniref:RiPP maturation radical SAM C-methyltransferase n=1 Tax=Mobilitalea sibirica TaxID=1462919 RepID=UPI0018D3AFDE|nr:RiPP maturation radical SAM C-methyltransferase [Mobilitalea sibirica]
MKVLLISMPFAGVSFASMGLSSLRPVLEQEGIACEILYYNMYFRHFVGDTLDYDELARRSLMGEWVFGCELYGENWANSPRGSIEEISKVINSGADKKQCEILNLILKYRKVAGAFLEQCIAEVDWDRYDIIGFTSVYDQQIASLALAKRIKSKYSEKIIVFGGANCQGEMGLAMMEHFPFVDWVFSGEAEQSFLQAIKRWVNQESLEGIKGLAYRRDNKVIEQGTGLVTDLDKLPYPNFKDYYQAIEKWAPDMKGKVPLSLELSRGCWWSAKSQCIFCGIQNQIHTFRYKSPERALSEINDLITMYGINNVFVIDSNLPLPYYKTVLPALSTGAIKLSDFFVETKANIKYKNLQVLRQAGSNTFQPGIESLDTEMLQYMHKGTTMLHNIRILKWARECGLYTGWNFLHSFPGEPPKAYDRMASIVSYLVHLQPPSNVGPVLLQRFSPMFDYLNKWNITNIRAGKLYEFIYPFDLKALNQLAYTFDFETSEDSERNYLKGVVHEIMLWKGMWEKKEPPLLAYEETSQGGVVVYDTRPMRKCYSITLEKPLAIILLACDAGAAFDEIRRNVINEMGEAKYPGDIYLMEGIKMLESYGFLLREDKHYLTLAYSLKTYRQNNESLLAYLLDVDE